MSTDAPKDTEVVYPESDGKPMADNTLQWDWMVKIVGELRGLFAGRDVFVAGDLFWYPVQGSPKTVTAPDALVVFGRPSGYRGSYKQWEEGGIAPQVVFEVLSPNNTDEELEDKLDFYERHGVEEYYFIDPYEEQYEAYLRRGDRLRPVLHRKLNGFVSPRLGVRFQIAGGLKLFTPDGRQFQAREEREQEILEELRKTAAAFEDERSRAIEESRRAELLATKLREMGVDPDSVLKSAG
ncbi:MAG TPA: Uma2 family endonuclease [Fimbriiglobus sp.]|nr:Uma2 family endonuclease [Fimbriiglobus sp.]